MDQIITQQGRHFSAIQTGPLANWNRFSCHLDAFPDVSVPGKLFLAEILQLSSMEISLNMLPAGAAVPFYHHHREHEEIYFILAGQGEMYVDETRLDLQAGAVVAIRPEGERIWRNTGDTPLQYLVIQARQGTLAAWGSADGTSSFRPVPWGRGITSA